MDRKTDFASCLKATGIDEIKKIDCSSLQRTDRKKYKLSGFSHIKTAIDRTKEIIYSSF
jgi:hypothetical protein